MTALRTAPQKTRSCTDGRAGAALGSARSRPCAAATTCRRWLKASRRRHERSRRSRLSTVLLTTILLTGCSGSRVRPGRTLWARTVCGMSPGPDGVAFLSGVRLVEEVARGIGRMRRYRRVRRQGGCPVHWRATTEPAPSRIEVAETGTRMIWERRVLTDACIPLASACCGPAAVRFRVRHKCSRKRRTGTRGRRPRRARIPR